ncbi:unnamed protein product [Sympodiomycopsis kandeliae]
MSSSTPQKKGPYPFWLGGAAACSAATITHPLDLTRYRLQTSVGKQSMFGNVISTAKNEGVQGLWHGLTATWLRQFSYSVTRFAVYEGMKNKITNNGETKPTASQLALCAGTAGAVAGITGNPAELVLVRTCGDLNKPAAQRFAYGNCLNGLLRITREEGVGRLFLGLTPNITRSIVMNISQLASYDLFKGALLSATSLEDGPVLQFAASFCAGTFATTACTPVDVVKSRVQNSKTNEGILKVIKTSLQAEGPRVFMRGWLPAWLRLQPQTTLLFLFFEQYKGLVDAYREKQRNNGEHGSVQVS